MLGMAGCSDPVPCSSCAEWAESRAKCADQYAEAGVSIEFCWDPTADIEDWYDADGTYTQATYAGVQSIDWGKPGCDTKRDLRRGCRKFNKAMEASVDPEVLDEWNASCEADETGFYAMVAAVDCKGLVEYFVE